MIQRIQSIFYLLAAAAFAGLFAIPMATTEMAGSDAIFADMRYTADDLGLLLAFTATGILLSFFALFAYRKRPLQLRFGYLVIVVAILVPALAYWLFTQETPAMAADQTVDDGLGIALPFLALIFAILGNYFVRKDEKLVRSMDRLR